MTVNDAISYVDEIRPNHYPDGMKVKWLSTVEGIIYNEILKTHKLNEGEEVIEFEGYTEDTNMDTELLVKEPYVDVYTNYLLSMIDYSNGEVNRYVNSAAMFNQNFKDFANYWNRTHVPIKRPLKVF